MSWKCVGQWRYSSTILNLGTRWRWVVKFTHLPLYSRGKNPRYSLDRRMSGPQGLLDAVEKRKISCPCQESSSVRLAPQSVSIPTKVSWSSLISIQTSSLSLLHVIFYCNNWSLCYLVNVRETVDWWLQKCGNTRISSISFHYLENIRKKCIGHTFHVLLFSATHVRKFFLADVYLESYSRETRVGVGLHVDIQIVRIN
jgi:hypothetical protein